MKPFESRTLFELNRDSLISHVGKISPTEPFNQLTVFSNTSLIRLFEKNGYTCFEDIVSLTIADLQQIQGLGKKRLEELMDIVTTYDIYECQGR